MKYLFYIFIFSVLSLSAQKHIYTIPPGIPSTYLYNADSAYRQLLSTVPELNAKDKLYYADGLAYYHDHMLRSGSIYFNWIEAEAYLTQILTNLLEVNSINRKFKVYLVRNEEMNASAMDNGIIYINIGLLAEVKDEASIAAVLAHEVSHALNGDTRKTFSLNSGAKSKRNLQSLLYMSHGSRKFESRADEDGFDMATKADYNIKACYHNFMKFETSYRWYKSQYEYEDPKWLIAVDKEKDKVHPDSLAGLLSDHPDNYARTKALKAFAERKNGTKEFVISEKSFYKLKEAAKLEQLYIDYTEGEYKECLRKAFFHHLLEHENKDYLYYICECLRKLIYNDPDLARKGFLTENSKESVFEPNKSILHDVSFITLDTLLQNHIAEDPVYGKKGRIPFETYKHAYLYFINLAKQGNVEGVELISGLYDINRNKLQSGFESLTKHLKQTKDKEKEYTAALIGESILTDLSNNKIDLFFIESTEYYAKENGAFRYNFKESEAAGTKINSFLKVALKKDEGMDPRVFANEEADLNEMNQIVNITYLLNEFKSTKEIENENGQNSFFTAEYWRSKEIEDPFDPELLRRKKNFFHYEPTCWHYFKEKQYRSITVVKPIVLKHPTLGTYFFFEITYYNPIQKIYFHFDQKNAESFETKKLQRVLNTFREELRNKTGI